MSQSSFVKAMKDFFGLLPGQSVMQFGAELKTLSDAEKHEFASALRASGIDCANPTLLQVAA